MKNIQQTTRSRGSPGPATGKPDFSHGGSICHIVSRGNTPAKPAVHLPPQAFRPVRAKPLRDILFFLNNSDKTDSKSANSKKKPAPLSGTGLHRALLGRLAVWIFSLRQQIAVLGRPARVRKLLRDT
jgi:hypothetical protein